MPGMDGFEGKVVVVTGSNVGVGLETAVGVAALGATTVLACRNQTKAEAAAREVTQRTWNDDGHVVPLDLADLASVRKAADEVLSRWDRLKDEQKKTMLEQVHHDADRVTRLVTELLDISRLETGRLVLRRQMVDVQLALGVRAGSGRPARAVSRPPPTAAPQPRRPSALPGPAPRSRAPKRHRPARSRDSRRGASSRR